MKKQIGALLFWILFVNMSTVVQAMVFDNRFVPLFQRPFIRVPGYPSHFRVEGFFARATQAYNKVGEEIPLPLLFGPFDLAQLARSFGMLAGKVNPLSVNPFWVASTMPWDIEGKLQVQGFAIAYQQQLTSWLAAGLYTMLMRANAHQEFFLNQADTNVTLVDADLAELDRIRRQLFEDLELSCGHSDQFGPGDLDLYFRLGHCWEYAYKFRHIAIGIRLGALIATGVKRDINEPTSISFGGNGHHGVYGSVDAEFEVKEDLTCGLLLRVSKRFARTQCHRMPAAPEKENQVAEPSVFGVVTGNARVTPGTTVIFSPYLYAENLRDGFGAGVRYLLTNHWKDTWCDVRSEEDKNQIKTNLEEVQTLSGWGSDYVSLTAFYDFGKLKRDRGFRPIFSVTWDVPTSWFVAHNVAKTSRVTLGIDFNF